MCEEAVIEATLTAAVTKSNEGGLRNEMRAKVRREISPCMSKMVREEGKFNPPEELAASLAAIGGTRKDWANEFDTMNDTKTKLALEKLAGARQGFGENDDLLKKTVIC